MKAGVKVCEGSGNFEVKEIDVPTLRDDDLLIEIKTAGVCGADVLLYEWTYRGRFPVETPIVLGHECAGIVTQIGKNVKGFKNGFPIILMARFQKKRERYSISISKSAPHAALIQEILRKSKKKARVWERPRSLLPIGMSLTQG